MKRRQDGGNSIESEKMAKIFNIPREEERGHGAGIFGGGAGVGFRGAPRRRSALCRCLE